jgi:hypothetical protein
MREVVRKKYRKWIILACVLAAAFILIALSNWRREYPRIRVLYLHGRSSFNSEVFDGFRQNTLYNIDVESLRFYDSDLSLRRKITAKNYDIIYLDTANPSLHNILESFVKRGGTLLIDNENAMHVSHVLLGGNVRQSTLGTLTNNELSNKTLPFYQMQQLISIYDPPKTDYLMIEPTTAVSIVDNDDGLSVLSVNYFGKGMVIFSSDFFNYPNQTTAYDFASLNDGSHVFNPTAQTFNRLFRDEAVAIVSKHKLGFAVKRVYGTNGRPAIAWQNHFEVLSAVGNGSFERWIDICRENNIIASYSLTYGLYEWLERHESVGYMLGITGDGNVAREFYAAGLNPIVDGEWLKHAQYPRIDGFDGSFFNKAPLPMRASPFVTDYTGNELPDLIISSSDGNIYLYECVSMDNGIWVLDNPVLLFETGKAHVTPYFCYDDKNNFIFGADDGNIYFTENGLIIEILPPPEESFTFSVPSRFGNLIVCGFANGDVWMYDGEIWTFHSNYPAGHAAPRFFGSDMYVGDSDGYIYVNGERLSRNGIFNHEGNEGIKFGEYAIPFIYDLTGDGALDLIVGRLEYGRFSVALDSDFFPYENELRSAVAYANANFVPITVHQYTNRFKPYEQELNSVLAHKNAFKHYGIPWNGSGVNQHTWWTSNIENPFQSIQIQYQTGLIWNFGFQPANSPQMPSVSDFYSFVAPFYMYMDGAKSMMLFNATDVRNSFAENSVRLGLPVSVYYHTEYDALTENAALRRYVSEFKHIIDEYYYVNMNELQMYRAFEAAMESEIRITYSPFRRFLFGDDNTRIERCESNPTSEYFQSIGVRFEFADPNTPIGTNADIFYLSGDALFVSLTNPVTIFNAEFARPHIISANLPVIIHPAQTYRYTIEFLDDGLQQVRIYSRENLRVIGGGFDVEYDGETSVYTFTKYGRRAILLIDD